MFTIGTDGPQTLADLLDQLGGISPARVVGKPAPGTATEEHLLELMRRKGRLYELVDGILVEKPMGYSEGSLALWLAHFLQLFLNENDLGNLAGEAGVMRLMPGLVRIPNVSFVRWARLLGLRLPLQPIPDLTPDLAVEILSEGNTPGEMTRKLKEYFLCGCELVWLVDPHERIIRVHTAPDRGTVLTEKDTLDGGSVLPGFSLPVRRIFERLPQQEPAAKPRSRRQKKTKNG